jgi:hypothetical protein
MDILPAAWIKLCAQILQLLYALIAKDTKWTAKEIHESITRELFETEKDLTDAETREKAEIEGGKLR